MALNCVFVMKITEALTKFNRYKTIFSDVVNLYIIVQYSLDTADYTAD